MISKSTPLKNFLIGFLLCFALTSDAIAGIAPGGLTGSAVYGSGADSLITADSVFISAKAEVARGNVWILSIGINNYAPYNFNNCESDAIRFSGFFARQSPLDYHVHAFTLLGAQATRERFTNVINHIINHATAEDYFIFSFSGFTDIFHDTAAGKSITQFALYDVRNVRDTVEMMEKAISLNMLKDLFQFIPAYNQLIISEAGNSEQFEKEMISALLETNPVISALSPKNRIIIVPDGIGWDDTNCRSSNTSTSIPSGPINYFITSTEEEHIYNLFSDDDVKKERILYSLYKKEFDCDFRSTRYMKIFFEQDFIRDLQRYLPAEVMGTRGMNRVSLVTEFSDHMTGSKHALVIGTDHYPAAPAEWDNLANPILDASSIAKELEEVFGYSVRLLKDPPLDTIYRYLLRYAHSLDTSDQFVLFIAGHGDYDEVLDDGMIVCSDSRPSQLDPARNTYLPYTRLTRLLNKMKPRQILVLLDVCFGGTFDEQVAQEKRRSKSELYEDIADVDYLQRKLQYTTRIYLSLGGKQEVPDGFRGKHSPFAYKILEALRGGSSSAKLVTASELFEFVKKLPSEPLIGNFGDNQPGSEFVLWGEKKLAKE